MTTYCHIGMGRLGIAIANAMMLLQRGNDHIFFEPVAALRDKLEQGEFAEMLMVAEATRNVAVWLEMMPGTADAYIVTAGLPRKSSTQPKSELLAVNYPIVTQLVNEMPENAAIFIATNPPKELAAELLLDGVRVTPLRDCTDNLRKAVWGGGWHEANQRMLAAKGYTSYGPAVAIAKEVLNGMVHRGVSHPGRGAILRKIRNPPVGRPRGDDGMVAYAHNHRAGRARNLCTGEPARDGVLHIGARLGDD